MIAAATPQDVFAIAAVEVETWRATYAGVLDDAVLLRLSVPRQASLWAYELRHRRVWLWRQEGRVLGFGHGGGQRDRALPQDGEVYTLYVHPDAQGAGIGRRLLAAVFADLVAQGRRSVLLWVLRGNPSRFFYERMGGRLALTRDIPVGGKPVPALGYAWPQAACVSFATEHGPGRS